MGGGVHREGEEGEGEGKGAGALGGETQEACAAEVSTPYRRTISVKGGDLLSGPDRGRGAAVGGTIQ